jgi:L-seryl-tRNA(Ser) seleniumtransferase
MDESGPVKRDARRDLPAVDRVIARVARQRPELPAWTLASAARRVLTQARRELAAEPTAKLDPEELATRTAAEAGRLARPAAGRVVNATGVALHTNLGRAPLAPGAVAAVAEAAAHYTDLELDLAHGRRGDRLAAVAEKLVLLSGAEAALAVNNNAAALVLALDALARGRDVVVSRGELVEIGGSFRIPEICARAGSRLVEVGTTNRTHARDYESAIGPQTALLLKVHRSNFSQQGFVAEVELPELAAIGRERGVPVLEDLGSGTLVDLHRVAPHVFPPESHAGSRLRLGADLVCFSGDKLLGGPQAGIVLGGAAHVAAMRRSPLARALRLDKLSLAALDWTLAALLRGRAEEEIPLLRQILAPPAQLEARARALAARIAAEGDAQIRVEVRAERGAVGGGSLPDVALEGWVVAVTAPEGAEALAARLRSASVPVLARIREDAVLLDVRTLLDGDEADVVAALAPLASR